jgi:putative methyltransferase (TIGR04325 family)
MSVIKYFAKNLMPPAIISMLRYLCRRGIWFKGDYESWEEASAKCSGYDAENILSKVLEATLKVKRGDAVFERDSVLFDEIEYAWPVLSGLMWAAARDEGRLNVLDFGGSLGSSYFQNRKFLQHLPEIRWNVVEQEHYVLAGKEHIQDVYIRFYRTIHACLAENKPNVVLLSSVLQYLPNPASILNLLMEIRAETLILDRTAYANYGVMPSIKIQTVSSKIYTASYPCRFLSEHELIAELIKKNYVLVETYPSLDKLDSKATWKGHIFRLDTSS